MKYIVIIITSLILFCPVIAGAFDNKETHKLITTKAADNPILENYLVQTLGFNNGLQTKIQPDKKNTILELLQTGSKDEDIPVCRAANHFHNPLIKPWDQSQ